MTHFGVMVRVPSEFCTSPESIVAKVREMMVPWQEHSCTGECPYEYMEFEDYEDEYRSDYEDGKDCLVHIGPAEPGEKSSGGSRDRVYIHDGRRLVRSRHEMFRQPGAIGVGSGTHKVPEHFKEVEVPFKELHATFEDFVADYHGAKERDPVKKRYGHWENPEHKWDYWRAIERIPVKGGKDDDHSRIVDLDQERIASMRMQRAGEIALNIDDIRAGRDRMDPRDPSRKDPFWDMDARRQALEFGILQCVAGEKVTDELRAKYRVVQQNRRDSSVYFDCWDDTPGLDELRARAHVRSSPIRTWAYVEVKPGGRGNTAWNQAGNMGWWAFHDAENDALDQHARAFDQWIASGDQNDVIVFLDCHT